MNAHVKKCSVIVVVACLYVLNCSGADKPSTRPPESSAKDKLVSNAKRIMVDPNNWKDNAAARTEFTEAANELGWQDSTEVQAFQKAAGDLFQYATAWVNLDEQDQRSFKSSGSAALRLSVSQTRGVGGEGTIKADREQKIATMQQIMSKKLADDKASEFRTAFDKALDAYASLYRKAGFPPTRVAGESGHHKKK